MPLFDIAGDAQRAFSVLRDGGSQVPHWLRLACQFLAALEVAGQPDFCPADCPAKIAPRFSRPMAATILPPTNTTPAVIAMVVA